jgi:hypothetical protein
MLTYVAAGPSRSPTPHERRGRRHDRPLAFAY